MSNEQMKIFETNQNWSTRRYSLPVLMVVNEQTFVEVHLWETATLRCSASCSSGRNVTSSFLCHIETHKTRDFWFSFTHAIIQFRQDITFDNLDPLIFIDLVNFNFRYFSPDSNKIWIKRFEGGGGKEKVRSVEKDATGKIRVFIRT